MRRIKRFGEWFNECWRAFALALVVILMPMAEVGAACSSATATLAFRANGGSGTMSSKTFRVEACSALPPYELPMCKFTRSGYQFKGWRLSGCCFATSEVLQPGDEIYIDEYVYLGEPDTYKLYLDAQWIESAADYLFVESEGDIETGVGNSVSDFLDAFFSVESDSTATITLSGLPSGLTYNKSSGKITGQTKKKGVYYVTCSAKNKQGYQMSAMLKWTVGSASDGDYDNIGLPDGFLENLCTGQEVLCCELPKMTVSGLPTGLKFPASGCLSNGSCVDCLGEYLGGIPTKPGKFVVKFTEKTTNRKAQKTVIVRDGGSAYQPVSVGKGFGTVTGGGVKRAGATVKLSAKPASGCYFAGWYTDEDCTEEFGSGKSGDYRTAGESFVFNAEDVQPLYARFVTKYEDAEIEFGFNSDNWMVDTRAASDSFEFIVDSRTLPKVTAKGLPTGVKLAGNALVAADTSKLKPGTSVVTLTARNLSGATATRTFWIVVPNLQSDVFSELCYSCSYVYTVGESTVCRETDICKYEEGWTISASGLPAGLKFTAQDGYCQLGGTATKAGVYTVTLTARRGRETEKATFTVLVQPFPDVAIGTYGGDIGYELEEEDPDDEIGYAIYNVGGNFSMTVAKGGKITVKFPANGKTVSLSGYSCYVTEEEIYVCLFDAKENWCDLVVYPKRDLGDYQVEGSFGVSYSEWSALGQRNVAKTDAQMKTMVTKLSKIGKIKGIAQYGEINCPACVDATIGPNVTFTVGSDGMVRASGKIDGRSVSGSALLQVRKDAGDYWLYADFYDYKTSSGLLVYRAVFLWSWLRDYPSGMGALCGGAYYTDGGAMACKPVVYPTDDVSRISAL